MFDWQSAFAALQDIAKKNALNPNWIPVPPTPYFKSISSQGKVIVGFNNDIKTVPNLTMINNGTIYADQLGFGRMLLKKEINNRPRIPVLKIEVIPGPDSNVTELSFKWNVTA
jgi:hypothetical protein